MMQLRTFSAIPHTRTRLRSADIAISIVVALVMVACGGSSAPSRLAGDPIHYLVTIDQLASPDFATLGAPASADAASLAGGDHALAGQAAGDGFEAGATERFFRSMSLGTANGPIDVVADAARFTSASGAHSWYTALLSSRRGAAGASALSTGPLGDEAGAVTQLANAADGTTAVQITIAWRVSNVVNSLVVRGRYGGTRLDDALYLARQQTANELTSPAGPS